MLLGKGISGHISYSIVMNLYVSFSGLITSVGKERPFFLLCTCNYVVSVLRDTIYCGTHCAFHIIIL